MYCVLYKLQYLFFDNFEIALLVFFCSGLKTTEKVRDHKGAVTRATKTCNSLCNIGAKQVEKRCCEFYHPRSNLSQKKKGYCKLREY